jgi:hypothetical protein
LIIDLRCYDHSLFGKVKNGSGGQIARQMRVRKLVVSALLGLATTTIESNATPLDEFYWKNRVLVVVAPVDDGDPKTQRQIYESAAAGMSERQIVLSEALGDSERSQQIRSQLSADGRRFQVFLVGKDGNTAVSSDRPLSAGDLFARVDAMPMRQDEMRRAR